jgi:hypothetical protein
MVPRLDPLTGDIDTGKAILRDYIKATVGFEKLGEATDTPWRISCPPSPLALRWRGQYPRSQRRPPRRESWFA